MSAYADAPPLLQLLRDIIGVKYAEIEETGEEGVDECGCEVSIVERLQGRDGDIAILSTKRSQWYDVTQLMCIQA